MFVCVITYWFGSICFLKCSLCGPQARLGPLLGAMGKPGPMGSSGYQSSLWSRRVRALGISALLRGKDTGLVDRYGSEKQEF